MIYDIYDASRLLCSLSDMFMYLYLHGSYPHQYHLFIAVLSFSDQLIALRVRHRYRQLHLRSCEALRKRNVVDAHVHERLSTWKR